MRPRSSQYGRTSTAKWRQIRDERRRIAQDDGLTNCPRCNIWLEWNHGQIPNSAEVDHIIPHSQGGTDHIDNTQVICRRCNQSIGGKQGRRKQLAATLRIEPETKINW